MGYSSTCPIGFSEFAVVSGGRNWKFQSMWSPNGTLFYLQVHVPHSWRSNASHRRLVENCTGLSALVEKEDNSASNLAIKQHEAKVLCCLIKICNILHMSLVLYSNIYIYLLYLVYFFVLLIKFYIKYCRQGYLIIK